ncbi:MAG: O-antigen ligase family protein [Flavobacteriales bacterium]|nr:O-antigen ligase family protein [Flavobacteriales bacterium]MDG1781749.1 O-antigen ligase family protein [Flavobacteriales bacterium]MDG2246436.1 O-antigen ligase family protein [Flavobacteriales bacterium]
MNNTVRAISLLYQIGLILTVVSLPFSNFGMSVASFWILGTWFIDQITSDAASRRYRWAKAIGNPLFWILTGLFLIHLLGLIHTSDWDYAFRDIRKKLPLILFPVVMFTGRAIEGVSFRRMWVFFVLACSAAALICLAIPFGIWDKEYTNIRSISVFISHIRFSILLVFATAVLLLWISERRKIALSIALIAINILFLWVIESLTGTILIMVVGFLFLISGEASFLSKPVRKFLRVSFPIAVAGLVTAISYLAYDYFKLDDTYTEELEVYAPSGEAYFHSKDLTMRENGHFIWRYIAWGEMQQAWNGRSTIDLDSTDHRGQVLKGTLVRYLASKGLRKDANGVAQLSDHDIGLVESGVATVLELEHSGLRRRLDKIFFEISNVANGGNPSGNSITQRLEFWKAAQHIIEGNTLFGVGTGDVKTEFVQAYIEIDTKLDEQYRLRAHNQYLTFWIAFGLLGVLLLVAVILMPLGVAGTDRGFLFTTFCVLVALSFMTEDTLETQAGVTFFAFFSALFASQKLAFHSRIRSATSST